MNPVTRKELIDAIKKYGEAEYQYGKMFGETRSIEETISRNHMSAFEAVLTLVHSLG